MTEWETKLRDFSSGTCHDDCCQENASLANAVDAALAEVERLRKQVEHWKAQAADVARCHIDAIARAERAEAALCEAAMSLETIAEAGGSTHLADGLLKATSQVRGYARNRAEVARAALGEEGKP